MSEKQISDPLRYKIITNHEEQFSFWREGRLTPPGWKDVGRSGSQEDCLKYIEEVWTDMRPKAARDRALSLYRELLNRYPARG